MRLVLALALVLLTWGLVGLWAQAKFGNDEWSRTRADQRWDARPLDKKASSVDFSQMTIISCGSGWDLPIPSSPVAILLTSTGALTIVLLVVGHLRREGPVPPPRSLRRHGVG